MLGGLFLTAAKNYVFSSGGLNLNNYRLLFVISGVLFVIPHILRKKLKSKKDTPTLQLLALKTRPVRNMFGPFIRIDKRSSGSRGKGT